MYDHDILMDFHHLHPNSLIQRNGNPSKEPGNENERKECECGEIKIRTSNKVK